MDLDKHYRMLDDCVCTSTNDVHRLTSLIARSVKRNKKNNESDIDISYWTKVPVLRGTKILARKNPFSDQKKSKHFDKWYKIHKIHS